MFDKLKDALRNKLAELKRLAAPVDPAEFQDPVAMTTEWTPLKRGGANFQTHKLVEPEHYRLEFRASKANLIFGAIFMIMGIGIPSVIVAGMINEQGLAGGISFLPLLFSLPFAIVGAVIIRSANKPIVFDKRSGYFWKGKIDPMDKSDKSGIKVYCELGRIHAFQIIRERVTSDKSSFYSYELNIVCDDGTRLNVVDHGRIEKLREDAARLASFLGRRVWDATAVR